MSSKKIKTSYLCSECGDSFVKWLGQCPSCKAWNSLSENSFSDPVKSVVSKKKPEVRQITEQSKVSSMPRFSSGIKAVDNLLGGGIMLGSVILLGGEPGIGKSTFLLSLITSNKKILYISGEESLEQIYERAKRVGALSDNLNIVQENYLEYIIELIQDTNPELVFIDSIQTIYTDNSRAFSGSISQIRESAQRFLEIAKQNNLPIILTGHITKEGQIAGPKVLEHAVDVVLYFESQNSDKYRFIRSTKNRFGSTGEIAIFEMTETGLKEKSSNETLLHLEEVGGIGSVLFPQVEGSRIVPLEIQALVTPTGFSNGRRIGESIDIARIHLIAAILEKYLEFKLSQCDIFVRVRGGMFLKDPSSDLALLLAMASSYLEKPIPSKFAAAGEISLTGKIRKSSHLEKRRKAIIDFHLSEVFWGGDLNFSQKENLKENSSSSIEKFLYLTLGFKR